MNHSRITSVVWKLVASVVCALLVFSPIADSMIAARVARAAEPGSGGVADTPTPVAVGPGIDSMYQASEINKVKSRIDYQLLFPLYLGALNAVTMLAQQLAYDTAEWVASGGKGKMPLIEVLKFGDYTKQIAYDAAGEFIGTVSEKFTEGAFGVNLCRPPRFQGLALQFALRLPTYYLTGTNRPKPKCDWTTIVSNWEASKDSLTQKDVIKNISGSFTTGGNDVSFGLGLNVGFLDLMAEKREAAVLDRLEGRGFKSVQSLISGNIQTPAAVVEQDINEQIIRQPNASKNIETSALLGNAFELGWMQIGTVTLSTFSNVLISRLLGKVAKGLFDTSGMKGLTVPDFANSDAAPLSSSGARAEQSISEQYRDILTPKIATAEAQDLLGELLGCPDTGRTKWNCAMDQSMEAALRQGGMTVRQAIDQGFINAQFKLIPSTQLKDNIDSGCAQRAFCVSNLRKLRLARIIPIGWELAADSPNNQKLCSGGSGCITLAEVMNHFDDCNAAGELDDSHPWCHLIDPNWVLTSFQAQCTTKGYGNSFIAGTNQRMQECQDTVTCLEKDVNGKCSKGYGYCLAEQTYYQFDSLSCKEQYVSCRTYTPRGGNAKSIGYLRSSLDYGTCDASNVGCMWYSTKRNSAYREGDKTQTEWSAATEDRVYLNKNVEKCDAASDGCTDLRRVVRAQPSLNMIRNSSFENVDDTSKALTDWVFNADSYTYDANPVVYTLPQVGSGSLGFDGARSYLVTGPVQQVVSLQPGRQYTLSFYARAFASSPTTGGAAVTFYRQNTRGDTRIPPSGIDPASILTNTTFFKSGDCATTNVPAGGTANQALILLPNLANDWQRVQCSFVAPAETMWGRVRLIPGDASWLVDGVKLEESEIATAYNEGVNPNLTPVYLKIPPQELGCSGDEKTDNPLCQNYARVCRAYEAGCQGYRPKNQLGAPEIPAVLSSVDTCPAVCVGYAQFRKLASTFDLVRNADTPALDDPDDQSIAAFVPSSATSCSAQDVGCEAFTVVDESANGAENAKGYSYLRLCEKPNEDTQTYYTWEGSEASGYQLVTWSMQRDTTAPAPQGPRYIVRSGKDGSIKDPIACNQISYLTGVDPDCRQFYDPQGNAFYRFESQTVLANAKCTLMRKSGATRADCEKTGGVLDSATSICVYQALPAESNTCDIKAAGCRAYLGTKGGAQSIVLNEVFTSVDYVANAGAGVSGLSLSEESVLVGDRSLRIGINSGSTAEIAFDVPTEPGMLYELSFWVKGTQSTPYSLRIETSNSSNSGATRTQVGTASVRQQWNVYRIGPFTGSAEANSTSTRIHISGFAGSAAFLDTIHVTQVTDVAYVIRDSWQTPEVCDRTSEGVPQPQAMLGCQDYLDRNKTVVHARQFTNLCRESSIGCTAFIDTKNSLSPFEERWTKGAKETPVTGAQLPTGKCIPNNFVYANAGVQNQVETALASRSCSSSNECKVVVGAVNFNGVCEKTLATHPADQFSYYIDEKTSSCKQSQVGCKGFGLPQFDQARKGLDVVQDDGTTDSSKAFETVYLKDDVSKYSDALCSENELFCEAYTFNAAGNSGTEYFRAPSNHACEYKEGVVVARSGLNGAAQAVAPNCSLPDAASYVGATYDGWFRVGTDCPCYPKLLKQGKSFGILLTGDVGFNGLVGDTTGASNNYQAWSGICPQTQAECTEFRDVNDQSDPLHPLGRPYFVINDERLDKETCNGKVDPGQGCVLFRDLSESNLTSNSLATFKEYALQGYKSVSPVDCTATPDLQSCRDAKTELIAKIMKEADSLDQDPNSTSGCMQSGGDDRNLVRLNCIGDEVASLRAQYVAIAGDNPLPNDTNIVIKVKADRSCSQWLACKTGETVYEQSSGQYKSICSQLELCNKAGANEGEGVPFCESYVNRGVSSIDTILKKYQVLTSKVYASRPIGFGSVDYSGFSMVDQFQVVDTSLEPVGAELSLDPKVSAKFKKDYRLVAKVPLSAGSSIVKTPVGVTAAALAGQPLRAFACYFPQTGAYGLFTDAKGIVNANRNATLDAGENVYCALSVDQSQPAQLGVSGAALVADNLNVLTVMQRFAQSDVPVLDQTLSRSFPNTQCKAAPQADAPYGSEYVIEWDGTVNPPIPKRAALGYGNANFCEYGENCSCVYKKISYGKAMSKFYEPLSTDVVNAVCVGGPRNALPCVPNAGIQGSQDININISASGTSSGVSTGSNQGNPDQRCGEGGICTPIANVSLVRGVTGQCLQYDISRPIAGDQSRSECLAWNPNPVLAGPSDQYHWDPKAGFQPPQTSGRYYCTSAIRSPRVQVLNAIANWPNDIPSEGLDWTKVVDLALTLSPLGTSIGPLQMLAFSLNTVDNLTVMFDNTGKTASCGDGVMCKGSFGPWTNSEGTYAGRIKSLFYADWLTSDGKCDFGGFLGWKNLVGTGCTGNVGGASLDGVSPASTAAGKACENIDQDQGMHKDENLMRIVTTGQGTGRSYTEYAILFNPWQMAYAALGFPPTDWETAFSYSLEDVIANFTFTPPKEKIECAYSNSWSGVGGGTGEDDWKHTDKAWHAAFSKYLAQGGGTLNRSHAQVVTEDGSSTGIPVKVDCVIKGNTDGSQSNAVPDNRSDENGLCFIKTWELNYRAEGQQKFQAFSPDIGRNGLDHLSRRPVYGKCDSANPWFSIRAVFEDTNHGENVKDPTDVKADQLVGPFQFVGLWVTACNPGDQSQFIYMGMKMNSADVCRELAETVSKDSHDSAAYTDRNWSQSGYSMSNGFSWSTTNMPYGASLATGDAGKQPLFMTGVKQTDVNPMNPPTFTSPGQTYFSSGQYPSSNWGMLSNVFAKIYRIYGYDTRSVTRDDWACTNIQSPSFAQWCPPLTGLSEASSTVISQQYCGVQGKCVAGGIDGRQMFSRKVCNSFSGVNRGLDCSSDPDICHVAPMQMTDTGSLAPQYGSCALFASGYKDASDSNRDIDARWSTINSGGVTRYRCTGVDCPASGTSDGCNFDPANPTLNETGCTRAMAIKNGAFRCSGSVRDPGIVKEMIGGVATYASYCTKESTASTECPLRIASGTCVGAKKMAGVLVTPGICEGYSWAQCGSDADCSFNARNYYPSGSVNTAFNWAYTNREYGSFNGLGFHSQKLNQSENSSGAHYISQGSMAFYAFERGYTAGDDLDLTWFTKNGDVNGATGQVHADVFKEAFWPATPIGLDLGGGMIVKNCAEEGACFYATKLNTSDTSLVSDDQILTYDRWNDGGMVYLSPGFVPYIWWNQATSNLSAGSDDTMYAQSANIVGSSNVYYADDDANLLQIQPFVMERVTSTGAQDLNDALLDSAPYVRVRMNKGTDIEPISSAWANYGACESQVLMYKSGAKSSAAPIGTCRGGGRDGVTCAVDKDCVAPQYRSDLTNLQNQARTWCRPITTGPDSTNPINSYRRPADGSADACWPGNGNGGALDDTSDPKHPQKEQDPTLDNNRCTRPAGYWPKPQYCLDPDDEYCGLFGYDLSNRSSSVSDALPLPTDVTPGLYTPRYLNGGSKNVSKDTNSYNYVDYYNPIPPHIAAPDVRTCQGQQCRVTQLDTFSVDGLAEGVVNAGIGNHVATIRFYGWAANEQMPLRRVYVDWGDGAVSELPDAYLKNRKPYCGGSKECSEMSGLTCQTDADCPPGGGRCVSMGTCSNKPKMHCYSDVQCGTDGGYCEARTSFGNDQDACEEQYFEFRHAYSCLGSSKPSESCDDAVGHCSRNPLATCTTSDLTRCAIGDTCVQNMSSSLTGCFDNTRNVCRFTPRVKIIDNWGWCTGECRNSLNNQTRKLEDTTSASVLHPNGGCFDASGIKSNMNFSSIIGSNECADTSGTVRPWIVYPGSVQLLKAGD